MAFRDRIEVVVDFVTDPAKKGLGQLKADVAAADGVMGKAKVAARGLGDTMSAYAGPAALAGAAAFVEFGRRSVAAFQETALAAGQFADATGIAVEDASRWIAVGDDFGISAESIQGAFMRMNRAIAGGAFDKYGIDVKRAADGTVDANATFQAAVTTIGAIPDATQRAQAAQEVFGRGYASIARIMEMDAASLADALGSVSDGQIIDAEESRKARDFQAAMDNLQDSVGELALTLGEGLVPTLTMVADGANKALGPVLKLNEATDNLILGGGPINWLIDKGRETWDKYGEAARHAGDETYAAGIRADAAASSVGYLGDELGPAAESMDAAASSASDLRDKMEDLYDEVMTVADGKRAFEAAIDGYEQALAELGGTMLDTESTTEDVEDATRSAADAAIDAAKEYATMEGAALNSKEGQDRLREALGYFAATLDPSSPLRSALDSYLSDLNSIPAEKTTTVRVNYLVNGPKVDENLNLTPRPQSDRDRDGTPDFNDNFPDDPTRRDFDPSGRSANRPRRPAIMAANQLWQQALDAWSGTTKRDKFNSDFRRAQLKYEVGDYDAEEYLDILRRMRRRYKFSRLSEPWMTLWREIRKVNDDIRRAEEDAETGGTAARTSGRSGGSSVGGGSSGSGGMPARSGARSGMGRRVTNINIELRGLFIGTEAEMRRAVRPLVPAISRELDKYERSQG